MDEMKVTVCFGKTGIVVGQIRVRDLTLQALQRYLRTKEKVRDDFGCNTGVESPGAAPMCKAIGCIFSAVYVYVLKQNIL